MKTKLTSQLFLPVAVALLMSNCTPRFYLSESEVNAYRANMRTQTSANDLWDNLQGQMVELNFSSSPGTVPRIHSSNLVQIFRSIPEFYFLEQTFRQIRLDRLATQLESDLSDWSGERLQLLVTQAGAEVTLQELGQVTLRFLTAPNFSYQANSQTISFDLLVRLQIIGAIHITDPRNDIERFLGWVTGRDFPDGTHHLRVIIDDYRLQGQVRLSSPFADAITIRITPTPGSVSVRERFANQNPLPTELKDGIRPIVQSRLSSPVSETIYLVFDHFALKGMKLLPAEANRPESELQAAYKTRPAVAQENLDVVARGEDGRLYHARKRRGEWQSFEMIPITKQAGAIAIQGAPPSLVDFGSDPAMVSALPEVLELVAVATNGELYYAGYRNGEWGDFWGSREGATIIGPTTSPSGRFTLGRPFSFAQTKPALVASTPGQLEVFALGTDGYIHHLRRIDGEWHEKTVINNTVPPAAPSLRDPAAVQVGNKIVLVYVDGQNRLFAIAYDLETEAWGNAMEIPTQGVVFAPAVVASGDGRVDLVYAGADRAAYHRSVDVIRGNLPSSGIPTGMIYDPQTRIGGILTSSPFLTCSGFRQLELIARGTDNRIYHNHFVGPESPASYHEDRQINRGWQGWEDASEMLFGSIQLRRFSEDVALAATRSGQVHAIARSRGNGPKRLYHNFYNSSLYGVAPWKAVHWRGFERIDRQRFVGTPALVLSGRELEITFVGDNDVPFHFNLSDQSLSPISFVENLPANVSSDPILLSTGAGIVDVLFIGQDGKPQHLRRFNNRSVVYETIPQITGTASSIAATSFGNGQIELVAVMQNRSVYHWRYIHGSWNPPSQVDNAVSSQPAIVNMGSGELALLAVKQVGKLHHWKFDNGQWQAPQPIATLSSVSATKFGPSAVSSWGDGTLDLAFVDDRNSRIFHRRIVPGEDFSTQRFFAPGESTPFSTLQGNAADTPILTAFGPHRLNLVAKGPDGRVYSSWTQPPPKEEQTTSQPGITLGTRPSGMQPLVTLRDTTKRTAQLGATRRLNAMKTNQGPTVRRQGPELSANVQRDTTQTTLQGNTTRTTMNRPGIDATTSAPTIGAELSDKVSVQSRVPVAIVQWRSLEPISWPGISIGGIAKQGEHELMAIGADQQGRVYINRYFGWRWKGFAQVVGQADGVQPQSTFKPGIAAH